MRGKSESINKPLSAALLDGVGQRRRRYVETGYHTPYTAAASLLCRANEVRSRSRRRTYVRTYAVRLENLVGWSTCTSTMVR